MYLYLYSYSTYTSTAKIAKTEKQQNLKNLSKTSEHSKHCKGEAAESTSDWTIVPRVHNLKKYKDHDNNQLGIGALAKHNPGLSHYENDNNFNRDHFNPCDLPEPSSFPLSESLHRRARKEA